MDFHESYGFHGQMLYEELTGGIISAFYTVYNALGYGFLEKVYEHALAIELRRQGFEVVQQMRIEVYYEDHCVGLYYADLVVNWDCNDNCVIEGFVKTC